MVVFFDIDGTVMDYDTQIIPESAVEAIRLLKKNGHIPVVNTGRPIGHVDPRIRDLDFSGWICSCGMELILDGEMIYKDYPPLEDCKTILDAARDCRMAIQTEGCAMFLPSFKSLDIAWIKYSTKSRDTPIFYSITLSFVKIISVYPVFNAHISKSRQQNLTILLYRHRPAI